MDSTRLGYNGTVYNATMGLHCECYDTGVGALKLAGGSDAGVFFDGECFLFEC
jgi:hypothetical protein